MRLAYQLLHDCLGVGCAEHVLHELRVLGHLLHQRLHARRGEQRAAGRTFR